MFSSWLRKNPKPAEPSAPKLSGPPAGGPPPGGPKLTSSGPPSTSAGGGNAVVSSIVLTTSASSSSNRPRRSSHPERSSTAVLEAHAQLLNLRHVDAALLETQLQHLDAAKLDAVLAAHKLLQEVFDPVAAITIQRHARGRLLRHKLATSWFGRQKRPDTQDAATRPSEAAAVEQLPSAFQGCLVFGALNMDLKAEANTHWPKAGTTTVGEFYASPGGKGANEAVAVACLGVCAHLVGRVGNDEMGRLLVDHLRSDAKLRGALDTSRLTIDDAHSTGVAVQLVTSMDKQKSTVICQGANDRVGDDEVRRPIGILHPRRPSCDRCDP